MSRACLSLVVVVCLGAVSTPRDSFAADPPPIVQALRIATTGTPDAFFAEAGKTREIFKRLGIDAERRYLQATLAGSDAGAVVLLIEYPNLAALAASAQKLQNDDEWQAYIQRNNENGISIESNSIWIELEP